MKGRGETDGGGEIREEKSAGEKSAGEQKAGRRIVTAAVLLAASVLLMWISVQIPAFAEWYSKTIYPFLVTTVGRIMGLFPFSVAELCLYLLILGFAVSGVI